MQGSLPGGRPLIECFDHFENCDDQYKAGASPALKQRI
jgi:hypothetical protein